MINTGSSDPFPPRPDFSGDPRLARRARRRKIRYVVVGAFIVVGVVMLLVHRYTSGLFFLGWGVLRLSMLGFQTLRRRRRAREWGSSSTRGF